LPTSSLLQTLGVAGLAVLAAACDGDEVCGPGEVPVDGITLTVGDREVRYEGFTSSANNDCTIGSVTSLTIEASQVGAPDRALVLCLPAPDRLGSAPIPLDDGDRVQLIDIFAEVDGCALSIDRAAEPDGTATFTGLCSAGADPAGYALALSASLALKRSCGETVDVVSATLAGAAAVAAD
jgi:hypothetical protein